MTSRLLIALSLASIGLTGCTDVQNGGFGTADAPSVVSKSQETSLPSKGPAPAPSATPTPKPATPTPKPTATPKPVTPTPVPSATPKPGPQVYYVSTAGKDANTGLSEAQAWRTLKFASVKARAGDTIYVKAGLYSNDPVAFNASGTASLPITIEGYRSKPGDAPTISGFNHTSRLDATRMPLLDGVNRANGATGINLSGRSYIRIRNLQVTRFENGIYSRASTGLIIENIIGTEFGDLNAKYSGHGIRLGVGTVDSKLNNSVIVNAGAEGIMIEGDRNLVHGCRVYANDNSTGMSSATDYYIVIVRGNYNTVENSLIQRVGNLAHGGHGIGAKYCSTYNKFFNNKSYNVGEAFWSAHRGAVSNWFSGNYAEGISTALGYGIVVRDGSSWNWFDNMVVKNSYAGISFWDTTEDESTDPGSCTGDITGSFYVNKGGVKNTFEKIQISNVDSAIDFDIYKNPNAQSYYNTFTELTVQTAGYLFRVDHKSFSNELKNSSVTGVQKLSTSRSTGVAITNTKFKGNGFQMP